MWIRLLYWLAIFENTSYFVILIKQTVKDIVYFMIILLLILVALANIISLLDYNNKKGHTIIKSYSDNGVIDSFLYIWLLMLG